MFHPITFGLTPLRQGPSLDLELGWWPSSPRDPPVSTPHLRAEMKLEPEAMPGFRLCMWVLEV